MTYDPNNIFAKILRGEVPCHKVYEDDDALVIMDVMPQTVGHALVVPKAPSRNLLDADPVALARVLPIVQRIAVAAKTAFSADGVSIMQFNETAGGQSVFHLHFHVMPRFEGAGLKPHAAKMEDAGVLAANAARIKAALV